MNKTIINFFAKKKTNYSILHYIAVINGMARMSTMETYISWPMNLSNGIYSPQSIIDHIYNGIPASPVSDMPLCDFPELPQIDNILHSYIIPINLIKRMLLTVCNDNLKYTLNGVYSDGARIVSIDGRSMQITGVNRYMRECDGSAIMRIDGLQLAIMSNIENVDVKVYNEYTVIIAGEMTIMCRNVDGKFPNYTLFQLKQDQKKNSVYLPGIVSAAKLLKPYMDSELRSIVIRIDSDMVYYTVNTDPNSSTPPPVFKVPAKNDNTRVMKLHYDLIVNLLHDEVELQYFQEQGQHAYNNMRYIDGYIIETVLMPMKINDDDKIIVPIDNAIPLPAGKARSARKSTIKRAPAAPAAAPVTAHAPVHDCQQEKRIAELERELLDLYRVIKNIPQNIIDHYYNKAAA